MNSNWLLKNNGQSTSYPTFPIAYRTANAIVRKAIEDKKNVAAVTQNLFILGPPNSRGERREYTYAAATELARDMNLLTMGGGVNSREFKKKNSNKI